MASSNLASKRAVFVTLSLGISVLFSPDARSADVSGDIKSPATITADGTNGTTALFAYSEDPAAGLSNVTQTGNDISFGNPPALTPFATSVGATSIRATGALYGPTVQSPALAKFPPKFGAMGVGETLSSGTNVMAAKAVIGRASYNQTGTGLLSASGSTPRGKAGRAAGAAFDPISLTSGSYAYQATVGASFSLDGPTDVGGASFFAVDSRQVPGGLDMFSPRGQPTEETLWALTLNETGQLAASSDNSE